MSKYTSEMVSALTASAPITFEIATDFAEKWADKDVTVKSIVAKTKSLGLEYIPKQKVARKTSGIKKSDIVRSIESEMNLEQDSLSGLTNATMESLNILLQELIK